jgi:hypothetical protein
VRRIVNSTYVSLDGVIVNAQDWPSDRHEDGGRGLERPGGDIVQYGFGDTVPLTSGIVVLTYRA